MESGPLPAGAYITDIVVDPENPEAVWVATNGAGVYHRDGLEAAWERFETPFATKKVFALAWTPGPEARLLVGGEASGPQLGPGGVPVTILDLVPHPHHRDRVFVLTPEGVWRVDGVVKSGLRGGWKPLFSYADWQAANRRPDWPAEDWRFTRFQKLTLDPHDPETLLLGARWEGGYHRSDDGGRTWTHHCLGGIFRRADELRVDPFEPRRYYAFTHHQGLLVSHNGGRSWGVTGEGLLPQRRTPHYGAFLLGGISFDPNTPGRLLAGSDYSTWLSEDHGETWAEVGITLTCEFVRATAFHPGNPDILYAGSNVGFYQSTDGGRTWEPANSGFPERHILQMLEVTISGRPYQFARVAGSQPVYRRPLDQGPAAPWRSMNWEVREPATDLQWEPETQRLVLTMETGETLWSGDGGFRWSTPHVRNASRTVRFLEGEVPADTASGSLIIQNAVVPDPEPLLDLYKRPPFVRIQLVGPDYPQDGSVPHWETWWETRLSGPLTIPADIEADGLDIRVEVRDFQDGTRAGRAAFAGRNAVTTVWVQPVHELERHR